MTDSTSGIEREALDDGVEVVTVRGELDLFVAPDLKQAIAEAVEDGARRVMVDLSEAAFVDSSGLGVLLDALRRLRARDGQLVLVDPTEAVGRTFEIAGVDQIFEISPSRAAAVAVFAPVSADR